MLPDLPRLAEHLAAEGLRYVLVGGLAVMIHGGTRITQDADIAVAFDLENRRRLVEALRPLNPRPMRLASGAAWEWDEKRIRAPWTIFATDAGRLDLIVRLPGVDDGFEGLYQRSEWREADGVRVRLASIDDLLAMKREADRDKDRDDVRQLRAIQRILNEG
ncbi:hypothetical protein EON82_02220 [bacterium]|nr:MAG: hypothetical protein EON82_02220 [bacterium]